MSAPTSSDSLPLTRRNYLIVGAGIVLLLIGFALMAMDRKFVDATKFSMALYVCPVLILLAYGVIGYGILARRSA
jgi:hypothetical protein